MKKLMTIGRIVLCSLVVFSNVAFAHHSRTNFVMDTLLDLEGTITDYSYRNPHIYLTIEAETEQSGTEKWLLEANALSTLRKAGWAADSFAIGEHIIVQANPDRDPSKRLVFVDNIVKDDGKIFKSSGLPPGGESASVSKPVGSKDFAGVWQPDFASRDIAEGFRPTDLPLTPEGQAALSAYNQDDDPALDCEPESMPSTILPVFPVRFTRVGEDELHIWYEEFDGQRIVHLGMTEHPADLEPSLMGHSIGFINGDVLEVDTVGFQDTVWGLGRGAPSSQWKHITERYELIANGTRLMVEYWFEDPVYLATPIAFVGNMFLKPGYDFEAWACDPEAARRHLDQI